MSLKGKIIVIEGTDGTGKATQTQALKERLTKDGEDIYSISFPNYDSASSAAVKMYLNGEIASSSDEISSKPASVFYAIDRYISYKKYIEQVYVEKNKVLIFDRYTSSNIIHQGGQEIKKYKDGSKEQEEALENIIKWIENFEYEDMGIPRADITIYLNVPIEYTIELRKKRLNKITGEAKQDLLESDNIHLINASKSGLMAAKLLGWHVIECIKDNKMRTIEDIHDEIYEIVKKG